jgi:hypothetical protein
MGQSSVSGKNLAGKPIGLFATAPSLRPMLTETRKHKKVSYSPTVVMES